jgi:predicted MFS family arabinose efflux permease
LLLILAAVQFNHIVDFTIMMPLETSYQRDLHISTHQFSLLVSVYAFSACLSGLLAASLVDRFDRKRALLFLFTGFTGGTALCAGANSFGVLLLGRALAGAFGGILSALSLAIIGDAFPEERRGLATGVVMSSFSVATIVGIPAGLFLAEGFGTRAPFAALAALSACVLLLALRVIPPLRHHLGSEDAPGWKVLLQPAHVKAYVLMTCLVLGTFTIIPFLPAFLEYNVGWKKSDLALMYLCGGLATLVTLSLFGRLADHFGKLPVFRVLALLAMVPVLLITNQSREPLAVGLVYTTLYMILASGRMVPAMAMVTSSARTAYRGSFMSVIASVQQMAIGLAAQVAAVFVRQPGGPNAPLENYPLVGLFACSMTVVAVILVRHVHPAADLASTEVEEEASAFVTAVPLPEPVREAS